MAESSPSPGDSLLGKTVAGRYRVISKLGEGGMGLTYRAWDEAEGRPVVLKMPRRNLVENAAFLERFSREVRMMAALSHPSIVPILDVGEDEGLPILVMRFLPGGSLSNRRLRDAEGKVQPMQPSTLQLWLPAVASALDFVHANGIVHRDVKPANIFFDAFWGAYLGDFGIAKIVEDTTVLEKEHTLTATSMAIGTQEYMAPEQFTPKAVVDGRVDQYALAVMVYEILVGQRPFRGETAHLVVEVTTQPVPRLTQFRRDLPDSVCHAVYRGLSKQHGERFASCAEFAQAVLRDVRPMADEEGVARLLCPQCGNMLKMPTSAAGRQGKCPRCKTEMMVAEDLGALWLAREENEGEEQAAAGVGEQESGVDSVDVFTSISNTTPVPKAGVRGIWSQLDPTVRRVGIGAAMLASLVATALLAGDYAAGAARKQLDATTATQQKLVTENKRLERKVAELNDANLTLNQAVENLATEKKQLSEKLAAGSKVSEGKKQEASGPKLAETSPQSAAAQVRAVTNSIGIEFVPLPAGKFQMGEGDKAVAVTLTRPFLLGKTEVTRGQWEQVMGTKPWAGEAGASDAQLPAVNVSWEDAREFCEKITARERSSGKLQASEVYRLPTAAEWEYACRAGTTTAFSFGDDESKLGDFCWFLGNSENRLHPVGTKQPNPWGLHDMHGNCYEWCSDWHDEKRAGGVDPVGPAGGSKRVHRGGGGLGWGDPALCRSATRSSLQPSLCRGYLGFRVVLSPSGVSEEKGSATSSSGDTFQSGKSFTWEKNGHSYQVVRGELSWPEAKKRCEEMGGHLVSITSPEEQEFVCSLIAQSGIPVDRRPGTSDQWAEWRDKLWLGGTDEGSEGRWRWVDGSPWEYAPWVPGQPGGDGNCLNICPHFGGGWNDGSVKDYFLVGFICEWPSIAPASPSQPAHLQDDGQAPPGNTPAQPILVNSVGISLKYCPPGKFTMGDAGGDSDEKPHLVTLTRPFYVGVHEVTNAQWKKVMGSVPSNWKDDDHPVEQVTWKEVTEFCGKLSALPAERKAGRVYRLPTEAEWEYACRAGTTTKYSFGNDENLLGEYGWFNGNSGNATHLVGQKKPNAWGLYDMHGNVWEWCSDWHGDYGTNAVTDPQGSSSGSDRVFRGGFWRNTAGDCRSADRYWDYPSFRDSSLGFRLALSPSGAESPEAGK